MDEDQSTAVLPEEIIVDEILLRLPVKPLFQFNTISKRYNSIISGQKFARNYLQRAYSSPESLPSLGLVRSLLFPLARRSRCGDHLSNNVKDLTNTIDSNTIHQGDQDDLSIHVSSVLPLTDDDERHVILASSNGLIISLNYIQSRCALYVSNPLTKQLVELPTPTQLVYLPVFGFATRSLMGLFSYRVVLIQPLLRYVYPDEYADTTIEIFSSDTGSWATLELRRCPRQLCMPSCLGVESIAHRGILHWLCSRTDTVITFDPFDTPDRFGSIRLPTSGNYSSSCYKSLIYCGEGEMLKCCEIDKGGSVVDRVWVWKLVDSDKGEWFLEGEFRVPSFLYDLDSWERHMVAPCPWNREVVCHLYVRNKKVGVINPRTGRREFVKVLEESARCNLINLIPIELTPWSSPFYAQI